jgi:pyridoxine 5'-phosphate synthase PdxJ
MKNPEKLATLSTKDTGERQEKQAKTQHRKVKRLATAKCWTSLYVNIRKTQIKTCILCVNFVYR